MLTKCWLLLPGVNIIHLVNMVYLSTEMYSAFYSISCFSVRLWGQRCTVERCVENYKGAFPLYNVIIMFSDSCLLWALRKYKWLSFWQRCTVETPVRPATPLTLPATLMPNATFFIVPSQMLFFFPCHWDEMVSHDRTIFFSLG